MQKEVDKLVQSYVSELEKTTLDYIVDIIEPHEEIDIEKLKMQELNRRARYRMKKIKDKKGEIVWYCDNKRNLINIEKTRDIKALNRVESQLKNKVVPLNAGIDKAQKRKQELFEQITLFDMENNA